MAMKEGLCLANRLGCNRVIVESDLVETVEACTGVEAWWSESAAIFAGCIDMVALIGNVRVFQALSEGNKSSGS